MLISVMLIKKHKYWCLEWFKIKSRGIRTQSPAFNHHVLTSSSFEHINPFQLIFCGKHSFDFRCKSNGYFLYWFLYEIHDFVEVYLGIFQAYRIELQLIVVNFFHRRLFLNTCLLWNMDLSALNMFMKLYSK